MVTTTKLVAGSMIVNWEMLGILREKETLQASTTVLRLKKLALL